MDTEIRHLDHSIYQDPETGFWEISGRYFSPWQFETALLAQRFIQMRAEQDETPERRKPTLPKLIKSEVMDFLMCEEVQVA